MNSKEPLDPSKSESQEIQFSSHEPTKPIESNYEELPAEDVLAAFELLTARDAIISTGETSVGAPNTPIKGDPSELVFTPIRATESNEVLEQESSEDMGAVLDIISKLDSAPKPSRKASDPPSVLSSSTRASTSITSSTSSKSGEPGQSSMSESPLSPDIQSLEIASGSIVGVGVDVVDVDRFRLVLNRRPGFVKRYFTDGEQGEVVSASDPAQRLAARFAVKEAVMKALGVGLGAFALRDVDLIRRDRTRSGSIGSKLVAPTLTLSGTAADLAKRRGVVHWHVSLTHTASMAMAVVVAQGALSQSWPVGPANSSTPATPIWYASSAPCENT